MRIVQVVPSLDVGGAERVAASLAVELRRLGHEVAVVSLYDPSGSWIEAALRDAGVAARFLGKRPGFDLPVVGRLARALRQLAPDVVHTHLHALKYVAATGRRRAVHTVHNLAEREAEGWDRRFSRVAFRLGVVPVAIGDAVARSLTSTYGIEPRWIIPNGIPVAAFAARDGVREATRAALGLDPGTPVVLTAGRLNPQKHHAALLDAFADPRLAALGARLLVAGDGGLRATLETQAHALGISARVRFLGVQSDIPALLAAADAFVLPSLWEGNPLVVLEAMAAGRPVIATSVGCVPELVTPETGVLVRPDDRRALGDALVGLAGNPAHAVALGKAGARVARERFDVAGMARAYVALYATIVRSGRNREETAGATRQRPAVRPPA